ncbi:hypothetical protein [Hansschlegelia zhihuaiae]|uniref:Uncharacterized protein n=1 Tax=Hansschlegelia zhihuaiae TaxID=405005 RepID=A0A4Q0MGK2_9HYPH|nr:hypothetical protein [Hansschlegelia zhihuaiae]RXF72076.1 hypothetical protein EK403_14795 [Hansschlegelia zhihuaiae]
MAAALRALPTVDPARATLERQGLFPCDAEIARRLSIGADKFRSIVGALEKNGFPPRDALIGRRYWPAVVAFWHRRYGLASLTSPSMIDGEENLDAL